MARKLRKKRVAAALGILILIIVLICFVCLKACSRGGSKDGAGNSGSNGGETAQNADETVWPPEVAEYVKEYKGAGELLSVDKSTDDKGRTVFDMKYKGTTVDSCFAYAKDTLEIKGEWTEEVTDVHYTLYREYEKYLLELSCEPKAGNGYDLLIKVRLK